MSDKGVLDKKDKFDTSVFQVKFQESSKMLDFCKSQQWQITSVAIAMNFGILYVIMTYLPKNGIIKSVFSFAGIILVLLICIKACDLLRDLIATYRKHSLRIEYLNSLHDLPEELQEKDNRDRYAANDKFFDLYRIVIWIGGILSISIMAQKLIRFLLCILK